MDPIPPADTKTAYVPTMFTRLSILGLGPHRDFQCALHSDGTTLLSGPSESGKSFVLEAILLCLWGQSSSGSFQPAAIHDDFSKAVVELTLDDGRTLRRSITRTRSTTRIILQGDQRESYANEEAFREAIGVLGRDPEALRLVLTPMAWQPLVAGNARKFRDVLGRILPPADLGAEIRRRMSGHPLTETECQWSEKEATQHRREARKERDRRDGRRASARERVALLEAREVPIPEAFDRQVLDAARLWEAHDQRASAQDRAVALQAEWDRQRAALGEAPTAHAAAPTASEEAAQAQRASTAATQTYQEVYGRYQAAMMQQQTFGALPDPSTCPMCQRPGWEQGAEMAAQAQTQVMAIQQEFMTAQRAHQEAHAALAERNRVLEAVRERASELDSWQRSMAALGSRPTLTEPIDPPPTLPRPDPEAVGAAREQERTALSAGGARERWVEELEAAKAQVVTEEEHFRVAHDEAERAHLLLEAIRSAPSALAAQQAEALGDLGPVTLGFGDNPAVTVEIDGRPYWLASRGRQVVADIWLRSGLRRALGLPRLPLAVDNVQDVGGQALPGATPAIHMRTTDADSLSVSPKPPR